MLGISGQTAVRGQTDYTGAPEDKTRFVHGVEWPRQGGDHILLSGGETNFQPTCAATNGAFSTFLVSGDRQQAPEFTFADEVRAREGNFLDGSPPPGSFALGCSVHWFEAHPTFHDQGVLALAAYENGTKFERIHPDGKIEEVGFFLPLGGSTSAPHCDGRTVYLVDYKRGLDIVQYDGPLLVDAARTPAVPEVSHAALLCSGPQVCWRVPPSCAGGVTCPDRAPGPAPSIAVSAVPPGGPHAGWRPQPRRPLSGMGNDAPPRQAVVWCSPPPALSRGPLAEGSRRGGRSSVPGRVPPQQVRGAVPVVERSCLHQPALGCQVREPAVLTLLVGGDVVGD